MIFDTVYDILHYFSTLEMDIFKVHFYIYYNLNVNSNQDANSRKLLKALRALRCFNFSNEVKVSRYLIFNYFYHYRWRKMSAKSRLTVSFELVIPLGITESVWKNLGQCWTEQINQPQVPKEIDRNSIFVHWKIGCAKCTITFFLMCCPFVNML